ncbi:dual specificity phosphatase, catalytic domain-containing protein [Hirsutella rhossiliensis]|uniref:Dual specificity phosphatase, catalytic domain-containing protein n=1 Tax=Hirsutella rhossiliensis TaxID=111463 RepID=A0A9P8SHK2_9HYPO|nr:dual specificity phosphatase, catalytic domain-containing protein [Hirsutella rhossiliensis]KAH0961116.1 dual specificity phosphatase, catalytic domain-containing protein [Hirsutella rhossiliensis]
MSSRSKPERSTPVSQGAVRMAPYEYRAPSPPNILVPIPQQQQQTLRDDRHESAAELVPSFEHVDPTQLSGRDLEIITRGKIQTASDCVGSWHYALRRQAQPILDFLYLGPTSVVRDHDFLAREAITMVLAARDARMGAAKLVSVETAASALGIVGQYIDIDGTHGMIRAYPQAVRLINDHMLAVHNTQALGSNGLLTNRHGKVLVVCESGNERSAAIVAAYIMAMFGKSLVPTIQFTNMQRFCCSFEADVKRSLLAWEDILLARRVVAWGSGGPETQQQQQQQRNHPGEIDMEWETSTPSVASGMGLGTRTKRGVDDMLDPMGDGRSGATGEQGNPVNDLDRFVDRDAFVPFRDVESRWG